MSARPGITELRDGAVADIAAALNYPTLLRRSPLRALAYAQAGLAFGQYMYLSWIRRQATPFTATGQFLEAWAGLVGVARKDATAAQGVAHFVGTAGTPIPAGAELRAIGGASYVTLAEVALAANGTADATILSTVTGTAYTLEDGTPLALASPIPGVQSALTADHVASGTDPELDDPFRLRMLLRWSEPPQGGAANDYIEWALAIPGVTRAWINPNGAGPGTVVLYTMWDLANAAWRGFPQGSDGVATEETRDAVAQGDQGVVADAIYPLRPATALLYSCAPLPYPVPFTIMTRSLVPQAIKDAVAAALDATFIAVADPLGTVLDTSPFETAISGVTGMPRFTVTSPAAEFSAPLGYLSQRGDVTWSVAG